MKTKRTTSSYVLIVGLMSLLVVGTWLAYQIFSSLTKTQITEKQQGAIIPLDGSLTTSALDNLGSRRKFGSAELAAIVFNVVTVTPSATSSGGVSSGLGQ